MTAPTKSKNTEPAARVAAPPEPVDTRVSPAMDLPKGVAVAILRFNRAQQVPGRQSDTNLKAERLNNGNRWEIEFIPQMRHHKITYFDRDVRKAPIVGFVHESHVLEWEPVPPTPATAATA